MRASAQLYKTAYLDTIDNIFKIARAIEILNKRYRGSGSPEVASFHTPWARRRHPATSALTSSVRGYGV